MKVEDCIFFQLASVNRTGLNFWNQQVEKFGLTGVQATVINFLSEKNGSSLQSIADGLQISNATATGIVDRMEKSNLLERTPNPDDRRSYLVFLTNKGNEVSPQLRQSMFEANQDFLSKLSKEEELMLRGLLKRLKS